LVFIEKFLLEYSIFKYGQIALFCFDSNSAIPIIEGRYVRPQQTIFLLQ